MNNERDEKGGEFEENWWTGKQCKKPLLHFSFTLTRGALSARSSGRFEPDSGAIADHNDGLPEELRFAQDGRGGGCGAHDSYDQQSKIAFALRRDVRYFLRRNGFANSTFQHDTGGFGRYKFRYTCKVLVLGIRVNNG
jgi:hypothetical protein